MAGRRCGGSPGRGLSPARRGGRPPRGTRGVAYDHRHTPFGVGGLHKLGPLARGDHVREIHYPEEALRKVFIVGIDGWRFRERVLTRLHRRNVERA